MPKRHRTAPTDNWQQLELRFTCPVQRSYELIRPVVLFGQPVHDRAQETATNERTVYRYLARFTAAGMAGLQPEPEPARTTLPPGVRQIIVTLKAECPPFRINEIATICYVRTGRRPDRKTIKRVLADTPLPLPTTRRFPPFHEIADPVERRKAIIRLHAEGWNAKSIAGYLQTSRQTVHVTLRRWVEEGVRGLSNKSHARRPGARKVTLRAITTIRRLQQNPLLGEWRIHSALKQLGIKLSPRTCGRLLALNRALYNLPGPTTGQRTQQAMPFEAKYRHQFRTVDIRYIDHQLGGGNVYCISILENYSRAILASGLSRTQDLTAYLIVLFAAIRQHGSPEALVSDGGGAFKAKQALEIYRRLGIVKEQIAKGQAWQSYIETQFAVQRRMADWHFAQASTWAALVAVHEQWVGHFNYQDHWAHRFRHDERSSPAEVLAWVCGRVWDEAELHHAFYAMRFGRKLDKLGYVRFRHWRMYGEEGLSGRSVAVWLYQEQLTIEFAEQPLTHYRVKYAADQKQLREVSDPQLLVTQYRSPQLRLWDLGDGEWLKVVRLPQYARRTGPRIRGVQGALPL